MANGIQRCGGRVEEPEADVVACNAEIHTSDLTGQRVGPVAASEGLNLISGAGLRPTSYEVTVCEYEVRLYKIKIESRRSYCSARRVMWMTSELKDTGVEFSRGMSGVERIRSDGDFLFL
jgi:hypothetical protein